LRQSETKEDLPVGRHVVVIGGGMTAIDIAVQSKRLGSEVVEIVYRRGPAQMGASHYEQEFAQTSGVSIRHWANPVKLLVSDRVTGIEFERTELDANDKLQSTGDKWSLTADIVFKAVGQALTDEVFGDAANLFEHKNGKLLADDDRRTSLPGVWAGGDCIYGHDDLTVTAVQDGKLAAHSIDRNLRSRE